MAAPMGNRNNAKGKEGLRALELALEHYPEIPEVIGKIKTLIRMWQPIIQKAFDEGDLAAMKEINDRLDGKPQQAVEHSGSIAQLTHEQWLDTLNDE